MLLILVPCKNENHFFLHQLLDIDSIKKFKFKTVFTLNELYKLDLSVFKGIIISGSHLSLTGNNNIDDNIKKLMIPLILLKIPILGICYGYQLLNLFLGGTITAMEYGENSIKTINIKNSKCYLFNKYKKKNLEVRVYHTDKIDKLSKLLNVTCHDENKNIMAFENIIYKIYGTQFHCEASTNTHFIIDNFLQICK